MHVSSTKPKKGHTHDLEFAEDGKVKLRFEEARFLRYLQNFYKAKCILEQEFVQESEPKKAAQSKQLSETQDGLGKLISGMRKKDVEASSERKFSKRSKGSKELLA